MHKGRAMSEMNSQNNKTQQPRLSRRSFISIALGSLTVAPALVTGAVPAGDLAPEKAYAAPTDATLKVASLSQVNIVLYDLTGGSGLRRIPNASIKVFHPNTNKTYDLNSGESGVATFDIADLADPTGLQKNPKEFKFYGSVEIRVDGYRAFRSGIMLFKGGTSVNAGTRRIEEGVPYPALCTFNQYDILYNVNEWVRSSENKEKHTFELELENAGTGSITFTLATADGRSIASQTVTPSEGVAKFKLEGNYLDSGNAGSLPAGKKFVAKYNQNGRNFQHSLHLKVCDAPGDAQSSSLASVGSLAPILFNSLDMNMAITFPKSIPYIGGTIIKPPFPDLPVHIGIDPFGYARISVRTPEFGFKSSDSMGAMRKKNEEAAKKEAEDAAAAEEVLNTANQSISMEDTNDITAAPNPAAAAPTVVDAKESSWKWHPRKAFKEQLKDYVKQWNDAVANTGKAWNNKGGAGGTNKVINWTKTLSFTVMGQVTGYGEWRTSSDVWRLGLALQAVVAFKFTYMMNVFAGPVPLLIQAGVDLSVVVGYAFSAKTPALMDFAKYEWDFGTKGFTISIKFIPFFSIGIGIKGLASASLKVSGTLAIFFSFEKAPTALRKPSPHTTMAATLNGVVVLEIWLIVYEIPITKDNKGWGWANLYDNWRNPQWDTSTSGGIRGMAADDMLTLEEALQNGQLISQGDLANVAEVEEPAVEKVNSSSGGIGGQSESLSAMADDEYDYYEYDERAEDDDDEWIEFYDDDYHGADAGEQYPYDDMDILFMRKEDAKKLIPTLTGAGSGAGGGGLSGQSEQGSGAKTGNAYNNQEPLQPESDKASGQSAAEELKDEGTGVVPASVAMAENSLSLSTGEVSKDGGNGSGAGNAAGSAGAEGAMGAEGTGRVEQQTELTEDVATTTPNPNAEGTMGTEGIESNAQGNAAAASSDGLQAQSEPEMQQDEPGLTAQATGPRARVKKVERCGIGSHDYREVPSNAYISSRGPERGLIPASDTRIMNNVLSDTRTKICTVCGHTIMFRLGTVQLRSDGTVARSRIMYSLLDAKTNTESFYRYINFDYSKDGGVRIFGQGAAFKDPGPNAFAYVGKGTAPRKDYDDYDFDVYVEEKQDPKLARNMKWARLHFVIVSGNDRSSVAKVLSNPVITYLQYDVTFETESTGWLSAPRLRIQGWPNFARTVETRDLFAKTEIFNRLPAHNLSCPNITYFEDEKQGQRGQMGRALIMTFLDRAAAKDAEVLTEKAEIYLGVLFATLDDTAPALTVMKADDLCKDSNLYPIQDRSVREVSCSGRIDDDFDGEHLVIFTGSKNNYYFFLKTHAAKHHPARTKMWIDEEANVHEVNFPEYYAPKILSIRRYNPGVDENGEEIILPKLIKWPGHDQFLGVDKGKLKWYRWMSVDREDAEEGLGRQGVEVGPEGFDITEFSCDPTGRFIYYPASRVGSTGYDANGSLGKNAESYRIMASKLHGVSFSEPFVFAEVNHPMDQLVLVSSTANQTSFVSANCKGVAGAKKGQGEIWYTIMPTVRSITVVACKALGEYVFPGEKVSLHVSVRNDGNTYLTGFTARLRDLTTRTTGREQVNVVFTKSTLVESGYNPAKKGGAPGELQNVLTDARDPNLVLLAPGKSAVFLVEFTVPDDWTGTRKVTVLASYAKVASSDSDLLAMSEDAGIGAMSEDDLTAMADENIYAYDEDWPDDEAPYDDLDIIADDFDELDDAPIQVPADGGNGDDGSLVNVDGTQTAARQALPRTADGSSLGPIAAAAGAAGAAMIAYSRRRARIEKQLRDQGVDLDDD